MDLVEYEFTFMGENIVQAPERPGVVALYDNNGFALTIASAVGSQTIREFLTDCYRGLEGPELQASAFYGFELCDNPIERELELLEEHQARYGRTPLLYGS